MSNCIKAEWFRITHSGRTILGFVLVTLLCLFQSFNAGSGGLVFDRYIVSENFMVVVLLLATMIGAAIGPHFQKRTACYEIMDGKPTSVLVSYRVVVYIPISLIMWYLPVAAILLINDGGEGIWRYLALLLLVYLRLIFFTIFTSIAAKSVTAVMLPYARSMICMIIMAVMGEFDTVSVASADSLDPVLSWFPMPQGMYIAYDTSDELMIKVTVGFIAETVLWAAFAVISYKRKWVIHTIVQ